jgi:hypothetical protein
MGELGRGKTQGLEHKEPRMAGRVRQAAVRRPDSRVSRRIMCPLFSTLSIVCSSLLVHQTLPFEVCVDDRRPKSGTCCDCVTAQSRRRSKLMEYSLAASCLKCGEVLTTVEQRIELIPIAIKPDRLARIVSAALEDLLIDGADSFAAVAQPTADEIDYSLDLLRMLARIDQDVCENRCRYRTYRN